MHRRYFHALALAAIVATVGAVSAAVTGVAAAPIEKQLFAPLPSEAEPAVQRAYAALIEFLAANQRWPASLEELSAFAKMRGLPLDTKAFKRTSYSVSTASGVSTASFAFTLAGSNTPRALAVSYDLGQ